MSQHALISRLGTLMQLAFVPADSLPRTAEVGRHVTLWQPREGGHVGFPSAALGGRFRWVPMRVASFFGEVGDA